MIARNDEVVRFQKLRSGVASKKGTNSQYCGRHLVYGAPGSNISGHLGNGLCYLEVVPSCCLSGKHVTRIRLFTWRSIGFTYQATSCFSRYHIFHSWHAVWATWQSIGFTYQATSRFSRYHQFHSWHAVWARAAGAATSSSPFTWSTPIVLGASLELSRWCIPVLLQFLKRIHSHIAADCSG